MGARTLATSRPQSSCRSSPRGTASDSQSLERPRRWGSALGDYRPSTSRRLSRILPPTHLAQLRPVVAALPGHRDGALKRSGRLRTTSPALDMACGAHLDVLRYWAAGDDGLAFQAAGRRVVGQLDLGRPRRSTQHLRRDGFRYRVRDRPASGVGCPVGVPSVGPALGPVRDTRHGLPPPWSEPPSRTPRTSCALSRTSASSTRAPTATCSGSGRQGTPQRTRSATLWPSKAQRIRAVHHWSQEDATARRAGKPEPGPDKSTKRSALPTQPPAGGCGVL